MDSGMFLPSTESQPATTKNSRPRPLHTCGVSILTIAHKAYTKVEEFGGPTGSLAKRLATLASPILCIMQYQWLAILSFADDQILAMENMVETVFPPSAYVFNKIDMLVHLSEILPGKFDNVVDELPVIIGKVPFLNLASTHLCSGLQFLISTLTDWRTDAEKEKEIMIDINCDDLTNEVASEDIFQCPTRTISHAEHENEVIVKPNSTENCHVDDTPQTETKSGAEGGDEVKPMKCTYKEVLEKGKKENVEKKDDFGKDETQKAMVNKGEVHKEAEKHANGRNEGVVKEDPILELFESGWHMNPGIGAP